jgi:hypothetical protein
MLRLLTQTLSFGQFRRRDVLGYGGRNEARQVDGGPPAATAQVAQPLSKQLVDRWRSIGTIPDEFLYTRQKAVEVGLV